MDHLQYSLNITSAAIAMAGLCGGIVVILEFMAKRNPDKTKLGSIMYKIAFASFLPFTLSIISSVCGTYSFCTAKALFIIAGFSLMAVYSISAGYFLVISHGAETEIPIEQE